MIAERERLAYAAGDTGFNFIWQSIELYLLYFYVTTLGLPIAFASAIFLVGAAVDWLADPVIGAAADRAAPGFPLRAWLLVGGPATGAALALAFAHPPLPEPWLAGWALASHVLLRITYSIGNIPYAALTARLSDDSRDHVALTARRMQGAAVGGIIAAVVHAALPASSGGEFVTGAIILGVLAQPLFLVTYVGVRERVAPAPAPRLSVGRNLAELFAMLRRSRPLRHLMLAIITAGMTVTTVHKSIMFYFSELGAARFGFVAAILPSLALLLTVAPWSRLAERLGRTSTLIIAAMVNAVALVAASVFAGNLAAATAAIAVAVVAGCGMSVMFWALVPATINSMEAGSTGSYAARVFALGTTARKLGQALAPQVIALSLLGGGTVLPGLAAAAIAALAVIRLARPSD